MVKMEHSPVTGAKELTLQDLAVNEFFILTIQKSISYKLRPLYMKVSNKLKAGPGVEKTQDCVEFQPSLDDSKPGPDPQIVGIIHDLPVIKVHGVEFEISYDDHV